MYTNAFNVPYDCYDIEDIHLLQCLSYDPKYTTRSLSNTQFCADFHK